MGECVQASVLGYADRDESRTLIWIIGQIEGCKEDSVFSMLLYMPNMLSGQNTAHTCSGSQGY